LHNNKGCTVESLILILWGDKSEMPKLWNIPITARVCHVLAQLCTLSCQIVCIYICTYVYYLCCVPLGARNALGIISSFIKC